MTKSNQEKLLKYISYYVISNYSTTGLEFGEGLHKDYCKAECGSLATLITQMYRF